jgi:phosphoglycolate phosphatase
LWDSASVVVQSFKDEIKLHNDTNYVLTDEILKSQMGKTAPQIAKVFFPDLKEERAMELMALCAKRERIYLAERGGKLFDNLENTLIELQSKGYKLYIISNCECGYIETFMRVHKLEKYFEDTECHENTGLSKGENIKLMIKRNSLDKAIYVGDTQGDCDATRFAGIPFVFAEYGFGNAEAPDYTIHSLDEVVEVANKIFI